MLACEILSRLVGKRDIAVLPCTDDEPFRAFFIDMFGFVQGNYMRRAINRLGQFFLPFLHLAFKADDYIVLEVCPFNGNRAKGCLIDVWFHFSVPPRVVENMITCSFY